MIQTLLEIFRLKKRLLLITTLLLLITLILSTYVWNYQTSAIADAQITWSELRQKMALVGKQDVSLSYRQGKDALDSLEARIPLKREFPRVLGDILEAAAASGVITGNISYKPQVIKNEKLLAYSVSMNVGGGYASIKSFLADVLKSREFIVVDGFTLNNTDLYEEYVSMDLRLTVYLRENP
ncbi:type 4a pilus biogenesis protein PilO [Pelotalea chapellei]|uniref:Type 4a pilus biogenesis protein PilO n=1 Tax=Pelotalea chapellei TaxID=44671 RepID=A0ABS5U6Z4_9BACT|nr:type 4a pilus biogenesis protein PilO [Pelotalea chapellei]MBT1071436.1 type 4a pilus biogenesis protein PilO [Pelotalea chapellei]